MRKCLAAALVAASISICNSATADPITDDLRCYIVTSQMLASENSADKLVAMMAHGYWLGRIDGRAPDLDLEERLIGELPNMTKSEFFRAEAVRCGQEMIARGKAVSAIGESMKKRGLKAMQEENIR